MISFASIFISLANSFIVSSSWGKNSCNGGSNNLILTGLSPITLYISTKSCCCIGSSLSKASTLSFTVFDKIIFLTAGILSSSKNICSVLQSPIPSAPKSTAALASLGLSALVLTLISLISSTQFINFSKLPVIVASTLATSPKYTTPVEPSRDIKSPSFKTKSSFLTSFAASSTLISPHPATQHLPIPLATTAAWEVIPPLAVSIPSEHTIPSISSGEVSCLTSITFSPFCEAFAASSALKYILPLPAPGDAGKPFVKTVASFNALSSNLGWSNWSNCLGSILIIASSLVISPSLTKSTATFMADAAVLLPFLVCKKNNLPFSIVNSTSCISL